MIAVDTSALLEILLHRPQFDACITALSENNDVLISAGTLTEAYIVAGQRGLTANLISLMDRLGLQVVPVTEATAERIGRVYSAWGKGVHPASLNFGDCFAYDVAKQNNCPLLFVGGDFSRTDIESAL